MSPGKSNTVSGAFQKSVFVIFFFLFMSGKGHAQCITFDTGRYDVKTLQGTDRYIVKRNNKWGITDTCGNVLIPVIYKKLLPKHDRRWMACGENGLYGLVNEKHDTLLPFQYTDISDRYFPVNYKKFYEIRLHGKVGYYTDDYKEFLPPVYDQLGSIGPMEYKYIHAVKGSLHVIIDSYTGRILTPDIYTHISYSVHGYYIVKNKTGKWGVLRYPHTGEIVKCVYDKVTPLTNRFVVAKKGKYCGLVSAWDGKEFTEFIYVKIDKYSAYIECCKNEYDCDFLDHSGNPVEIWGPQPAMDRR